MLDLVILKKIDFDKLIADKAPSHQAINAWMVTQR